MKTPTTDLVRENNRLRDQVAHLRRVLTNIVLSGPSADATEADERNLTEAKEILAQTKEQSK